MKEDTLADKERVKFYYLRDENNAPRITRCILTRKDNGEAVSIGTSICSYLDNPWKKIGKYIALARARKALYSKETSDLILRDEAEYIMECCNANIKFKSEFNPDLTVFEDKLINKSKPNPTV